jgi:DNA-binding transcriptional MerR regulator
LSSCRVTCPGRRAAASLNAQFAQASSVGIGEVLAELRSEFPDISVSKIRFLEAEGLISPARSPSGYRRFGPADVEKLRYILTAQRDQYLPLRVIKERLDSRTRQQRAEMVGRLELLDAAGIDEQQLAELEAHDLVRRVGRLYSQDALDVAATVGALASYGVQPRHLRTVRTAAERDISLIEQLVGPVLRQKSSQARESAGHTAREIAALLLRLHRAMLESALADAGLPGDELPDARPSPRQGAQREAGAPRRDAEGASA